MPRIRSLGATSTGTGDCVEGLRGNDEASVTDSGFEASVTNAGFASLSTAIDTQISLWSTEDDETLLQARAQGLNWNQISPKHFPHKSANACSKRYERLMERLNLAKAYGACRREMWSILAARVGENWILVEQKCMEKGLKTLVQHSRGALSSQNDGTYHDHEDSGIGTTDLEEDWEHPPGSAENHSVTQQRVPTIQSKTGYPTDPDYHSCPNASIPTSDILIWTHSRGSSAPHSVTKLTIDNLQKQEESSVKHQIVTSTQAIIRPRSYQNDQSADMTILDINTIRHKGSDKVRYASQITVVNPPSRAEPQKIETTQIEAAKSISDAVTRQSAVKQEVENFGVGALPISLRTSSPPCTEYIDEKKKESIAQDQELELSIIRADATAESLGRTETAVQTVGPAIPQSEPGSLDTSSPDCTALDTGEDSSDCSTTDHTLGIEAQKEEILDRLMAYFYQIFTTADGSKSHGEHSNTPSRPSKRFVNPSDHITASGAKKRKSGDRDEGNEDHEDEGGGKRRRVSTNIPNGDSEASKRLACPYFKRKALDHQRKRACSGPGWLTVHRLKEHLYREHALSPHCRRCYTTFENETQLTEHSRSANTCVVTDALPPEGFDKDQEKKLKNRSKMFRADSEEQKWKIVYVILFPDTSLSKLPSAYYDLNADSASNPSEDQSPKAPELKQFDAFMRRELPRKVRKALEAAMEKLFGPVEETLKNELETIVRDCHETLTRSFLSAAQAMALSGNNSAISAHEITPEYATDLLKSAKTMDGLSQIALPPNSTREARHEVHDNVENLSLHSTWSDNAYLSQGKMVDFALLGDTWKQDGIGPGATAPNDTAGNNYFDPMTFSEDFGITEYVGKGKGRAEDNMLQNSSFSIV